MKQQKQQQENIKLNENIKRKKLAKNFQNGKIECGGEEGKTIIYRVRIIYCMCVVCGCLHNKYTPQAQIEETLRLAKIKKKLLNE